MVVVWSAENPKILAPPETETVRLTSLENESFTDVLLPTTVLLPYVTLLCPPRRCVHYADDRILWVDEPRGSIRSTNPDSQGCRTAAGRLLSVVEINYPRVVTHCGRIELYEF